MNSTICYDLDSLLLSCSYSFFTYLISSSIDITTGESNHFSIFGIIFSIDELSTEFEIKDLRHVAVINLRQCSETRFNMNPRMKEFLD